MHNIRILHTSDWHLGQTLHERTRDDEFDAFLDWMLETVESQKIDVVLIAGDIFDTSNASHAAQQKYYNFCTRLNRTCCRHAIITSGNHDSTSFIDVPGQMLKCLNIHTVGQARFGMGRKGNPADEIIVLQDRDGNDELIVAAVPFLNEGDLRMTEVGEDGSDTLKKVTAGIAAHYDAVAAEAERIRAGRDIPVVAMGHLYVQGGQFIGDDGIRQTYVGTLGGVSATCFSNAFDYVALGHLHVPQKVAQQDRIQYSGSPIAMGFGEAGQQKSVSIIDFDGKKPQFSRCDIPCFHKMVSITGTSDAIADQIQKLISDGEDVYVAVNYTGGTLNGTLQEFIQALIENVPYIHCLVIQDRSIDKKRITANNHVSDLTLDDLSEVGVFTRLLDSKPEFSEDERATLLDTFNELLASVKNNNKTSSN